MPPSPRRGSSSPSRENWLHYRGNFEGWGYSPLDKITPANVRRLKPVWTLSTGVVEGHQAPPFVNNGVMFVTTPGNQVLALNAKTGDLIWRYKRELPEDIIQSHPTNRGVGLYGNKVYLATLDAFVVALDAQHRQGALGNQGRRLQARLLLHAGAARRQGQGDGRHLRRRVRHPRLRGCARRGNRQGSLAHLHDSRAGRARQRNLEGRGSLENGRRLGLDHRALRSQAEPRRTGAPAIRGRGWATCTRATACTRLLSSRSTSIPASCAAITSTCRTNRGTGTRSRRRCSSTTSARAATSPGSSIPARNGYLWLLERQQDAIKFVDAKPYVKQEVFTAHRSRDRAAELGRVEEARHRQDGDVLSVALGRQGLAAGGVEPEDAAPLHSRAGESVRHAEGRGEASRRTSPASASSAPTPRRRASSSARARSTSASCRPGISIPARRCGPSSTRTSTGDRCSRPAAGSCSPAARATACSARSTRRAARCCGSSAPIPASPPCRFPTWSTACSTSPCRQAGASMRRR